jgi:PucR family transcriptional regulator, purine catabolism regulatory protein
VQLGDLLGEGGLALNLVSGSQRQLKVEVSWVHPTELDDPTPWMQGGELVLTAGTWLRDADQTREWFDRLSRVGAVGVGLGLGLCFEHVPGEMLEGANHAGLPLLTVPRETPFAEVAQWALDRRVGGTLPATAVQVLRASAEAVRFGRGLEELVVELGRSLGCGIGVLDPAGRILASSRTEIAVGAPAAVASRFAVAMTEGFSGTVRSTDPQLVRELRALYGDGRRLGLLYVEWDPQRAQVTDLTLEAMALVVALQMRQPSGPAQVRDEAHQELANALARDHVDAADAAEVLAGVGISEELRVAIVRGRGHRSGHPVERSWGRSLLGRVRAVNHDVIAGATTGGIYLVARPEIDLAEVAAAAEGSPTQLCVGLSAVLEPGELATAGRQARVALSVARALGRASVDFTDLSAHRFVMSLAEPAVLEGYVQASLGRLRSRDDDETTALRQVLRALLTSNGNLQGVAVRLGIHRHTLRARLDRLEELTGRSLWDWEDRLALTLALAAEDVLNASRRPAPV